MAITRSQIAKQLLANGGRTGFFLGGNFKGGYSKSREDSGAGRNRIQNERQAEFKQQQFKDLVEKGPGSDLETGRGREGLETLEALSVQKSNIPGFLGMGLNLTRKPRQFTLDRNKNFYISDPRAKKAREEYGLDAAGYKKYMSKRLAGDIDAAGNPIISGDDDDDNFIPVDTTFNMESGNMDQGTTEEPFEISRRFRAEGGSIMPRLNELGTNVSSAEQMLQEINQRLESAESTLGEGGGGGGQPQSPVPTIPYNSNNIASFQPTQMPIGNPLTPAPRYASFGDMMANRIQSDVPTSFTNLEGVRSNPDGTPYTPPQNNQLLSLMTNQSPGGPMQSPLQQPGGLMQLQGSSGIPAAGYADGGNVVGGEYDFDSARQMYGLGKLVKKITRSVKKVAKSPIGKAALLYTGLGGLGSLAQGGSFFTNFANPLSQIKGVGSIFAKGGLDNIMARTGLGKFVEAGPGNAVLEKNFLGKALTSPSALITAGSAIVGMLTPEQEEQAQTIADETGIDIAEIRANPNKYLARRFRAEGGSMDEPVAKKTMPLLDMDGQEMDLRAEGGFVPIGRMEKADDVPARLSKNEFVFTAEAVRNAGEGDVDKGAEVMYNMMKNLESGGEVSEESQGLEGAREMFQTSQRLEEVI
jgi:hypothetical protein